MKLTIVENIEINSDRGRVLLEKGDKIDINTTISESKMISEAMPGAFKGVRPDMTSMISVADLPDIDDFQGPSTDPMAGPSTPIDSNNIPGIIAQAMTAEPQTMLAVSAPTEPVQSAGPAQDPVPAASQAAIPPAPAPAPTVPPSQGPDQMATVQTILNGLIDQLLAMGDAAKPLLDSFRSKLG